MIPEKLTISREPGILFPSSRLLSVCAHLLFGSERLAKTFSMLTEALHSASCLRCV